MARHPPEKYPCIDCRSIFDRWQDLVDHCRQKHDPNIDELLANLDSDINYAEAAQEVRKLCKEIVRDYEAQAAAEDVSNQKGDIVADSGMAKCHVCQLELDPKDLHDHLQLHVRAAALETYQKKKAEDKARKAEEKARKEEDEARKKAAAEEVSRIKLAEARARRDKKMKKPATEFTHEKKRNKYTGDFEIDSALKELASLSEKEGKKGKGKGSKPDAVQKNSQIEQTVEQNFNENAEQATENAVPAIEQVGSLQIIDENEVIVTETKEENSGETEENMVNDKQGKCSIPDSKKTRVLQQGAKNGEGANKKDTKQVEQTLNRKSTEGSAEKVCVGTGISPTGEEEMISPTNDKRVIEEQNSSDSSDLSEETGETSSFISTEVLILKLNSLKETIAQVISNENEIQKKILDAVERHVSSEGSTIESTIIKRYEKLVKARYDADWACLQERFQAQEKLNLERHQQYMTSASVTHEEFVEAFEQRLKSDLNAVVLGVQEIIPKAVTRAFQGLGFVGDKAVNHVLKADVEAIVSRNIQKQIQTSGKQVIKDELSSSLKDSVIPAFDLSCKTLSKQVDAEFNNQISKLKDAAQQKVESTHSPLAYNLKESLKTASSMYQTLSGEIADGQRKFMDVATASLSPGFTEKVEAKTALSRQEQPSRPGFYLGGGRGNISSGSFDHQMQPSAGPAYSGYGQPSYGLGGPNANAGRFGYSQSSQSATAYGGQNANVSYGEYGSYGSANAVYGGDLGGQSPGYGLSVGYVSVPTQSAIGASGYGYENPGEYRAAAGRFGPGDATSGDPGGGYKGQTGHSSAAWSRSDS